MDLSFPRLDRSSCVASRWIDADHSNTRAAYVRVGKPQYPTEAQIWQIKQKPAPPSPESLPLTTGHVRITLPVNGFALLEFKP